MLIVMTSILSADEAEALALKIIEARLAACVQILPQIKSIYVWNGKVERADESLLLIKTLEDKFDALQTFIAANHNYDIPEIVALKTEEVSSLYLGWLSESLNA